MHSLYILLYIINKKKKNKKNICLDTKLFYNYKITLIGLQIIKTIVNIRSSFKTLPRKRKK